LVCIKSISRYGIIIMPALWAYIGLIFCHWLFPRFRGGVSLTAYPLPCRSDFYCAPISSLWHKALRLYR
jgi:hypothetical protein